MSQKLNRKKHLEEDNSESLFKRLQKNRQRLNRNLIETSNSFVDKSLQSKELFQEFMEVAFNLLIRILNLILAIFGVQIPNIGLPDDKSPLADTLQGSLCEDYISEQDPSSNPALKSRPLAIKNYLRLSALDLPVSDQILRNISDEDLWVLNSLTEQERSLVTETETSKVLSTLHKISKPQAVAELECVIDTYDVKPIHPPKLLN